jgi:carboxypeptidase Taq
VQLWERAEADLGDLDEQFERGEFAPLREWLREPVHRHGRAFTPQELLQRVAGSQMDPGPYLRYLRRKLADFAGVSVA